MKDKKVLYWRITWITALVVALITFTPLVTPKGVVGPTILGFPQTFWAGIIVAILLVVLTFIASYIHPDDQQNQEQK